VYYRTREIRLGVLTFREARSITGWIRGTGRRRYNVVDCSADLLLDWRGLDSGIVFPRRRVQGWLAGQKTNHKRGDLFLNADPSAWTRSGWSRSDADLRPGSGGGASGATLGLYIKPQTRPRWPPQRGLCTKPLEGRVNPCQQQGGLAALRAHGPVAGGGRLRTVSVR
jgi:hypothetical protein